MSDHDLAAHTALGLFDQHSDVDHDQTTNVHQSVKTVASPTFAGLDLTGITDGNIPYMSASGFADSGMTWDNTNSRLGIGTASPQYSFHNYVASGVLYSEYECADAGAASIIALTNDGGQAEGTSQFGVGGTSYFSNAIKNKLYFYGRNAAALSLIAGATSGKPIEFYTHLTADNYAMVLDPSGNLKVGATGFAAGRLEVSGGNLVISGGGYVQIEDVAANGGNISLFNNAGTNTVRFRSYGEGYFNSGSNFGISTSSPDARLQVVGDCKFGDDNTNYCSISATGDLSFTGSAGFYPRLLTQADEPAAGTGATQCDTGEMVVWKDSDDSKIYLCFNDGGTVKTVELA